MQEPQPEEIKLEDVWQLVGQLYLENWRLNRQIPALQQKLTTLTQQVNAMKGKNVLTVEPKETVIEAA